MRQLELSDIAKLINDTDTHRLPEADTQVKIDNSDTLKLVDDTRKAIIEEKDRADTSRISARDEYRKPTSSTSSSTSSSSSSTSTSSTGYRTGTYSTKSADEILAEEAVKFARKRVSESVERVSRESKTNKWNIVDAVNDSTVRSLKTEQQLLKEEKRDKMELIFYRSLVGGLKSFLEQLYLSRKRGR